MKDIIAFAVLIAGISASAVPDLTSAPDAERSARFVTDNIVTEIENVSQQIKDAGLDPLHIKKENFEYALPVPVIFNANAVVEDLMSTGLSDIVVKHINYVFILGRLDLVLELPFIHLFARALNLDATLFGETLSVRSDGRIDIRNLVLTLDVRVSYWLGISISSVTANLDIPTVSTNIRLAIQGNNYSEQINELIGKTIPDTLNEFNDEINELLGIVLKDMINDQL